MTPIPGLRWQSTPLTDGSILRIIQIIARGARSAHYVLTQDHRPVGPANFTSTNAALTYAYAEWVTPERVRHPDRA